jgi:LmbE family N-acetylglucosaminyl deacetylase
MALTSRSAPLDILALYDEPKPTGFIERRRANFGQPNFRNGPERRILLRAPGQPFQPIDFSIYHNGEVSLAQRIAQPQEARSRVLAIGAHPDDVEIGCGGALARHTAQGDEVMILTLSRGGIGGDTTKRALEAERAAQLLGATLQLDNLPDTRISDGVATIDLIQSVIRSFAPTHIYTHSQHDAHQDHRNVYAATIAASRGVKNVYSYQSPSSTVDFRPNHFVDISEYIDSKIVALAAHESQVARSTNLGREYMVATAVYWGRFVGHIMAEPMEVVRQTQG